MDKTRITSKEAAGKILERKTSKDSIRDSGAKSTNDSEIGANQDKETKAIISPKRERAQSIGSEEDWTLVNLENIKEEEVYTDSENEWCAIQLKDSSENKGETKGKKREEMSGGEGSDPAIAQTAKSDHSEDASTFHSIVPKDDLGFTRRAWIKDVEEVKKASYISKLSQDYHRHSIDAAIASKTVIPHDSAPQKSNFLNNTLGRSSSRSASKADDSTIISESESDVQPSSSRQTRRSSSSNAPEYASHLTEMPETFDNGAASPLEQSGSKSPVERNRSQRILPGVPPRWKSLFDSGYSPSTSDRRASYAGEVPPKRTFGGEPPLRRSDADTDQMGATSIGDEKRLVTNTHVAPPDYMSDVTSPSYMSDAGSFRRSASFIRRPPRRRLSNIELPQEVDDQTKQLKKRSFSFRSGKGDESNDIVPGSSRASIFDKGKKPDDSHAEGSAFDNKRPVDRNAMMKKYLPESLQVTFSSFKTRLHYYQEMLFLTRNQTKGLKENLNKASDQWQIDDKHATRREYQNENYLSALHRDYLSSRLRPITEFRSFTNAVKLLVGGGDRHAARIELLEAQKELTVQRPAAHIVAVDGTIQFHTINLNTSTEITRNINIDNVTGLNDGMRHFINKDGKDIPIYTYNIEYKDHEREEYAKKMATDHTGIGSEEEAQKHRDTGGESFKLGADYSKKFRDAVKEYNDLQDYLNRANIYLDERNVSPVSRDDLEFDARKVEDAIKKFSEMRGNEDTELTKAIVKARLASEGERKAEDKLIFSQKMLMKEKTSSASKKETLASLESSVATNRTNYNTAITANDKAWKELAEKIGNTDEEHAKEKYLLKDRVQTHADHDSIEIYHHDDGSAHTGIRISIDKINFAACEKVAGADKTTYDLHFKDGIILRTGWTEDIGEMIKTAGRNLYDEYVALNRKRIIDLISLIDKAPSRANNAAINSLITTIKQEDLEQHFTLRSILAYPAPRLDEIMVPAMQAIRRLKLNSSHEIIEMNSKETSGRLSTLNTKRKEVALKLLSIASTNPEARKIIETNDALMHPFTEESNITTRTDLTYETAGMFLKKMIGTLSSQDYLSKLLKELDKDRTVHSEMVQESIYEVYFKHEHTSSACQGAVSDVLRRYGMEHLLANKIASTIIAEMDKSFSNWLASTITITEKNKEIMTLSSEEKASRERHVDITIQKYLDSQNISEAKARKMFRGATQEYLMPSNTSFRTLSHHFDLDYENHNKQVAESMAAKMKESIDNSRSTILTTDIPISPYIQYRISGAVTRSGNIQYHLSKQRLDEAFFDLKARKLIKRASEPRAYISSIRPEIIPSAVKAYFNHPVGSSEGRPAMYDAIRKYGVGHVLASQLVTILSREIDASRKAFWSNIDRREVTAKEYLKIKGITEIKELFGDVTTQSDVRTWLASKITIKNETITKKEFLERKGVFEQEARSLFLLRHTPSPEGVSWLDYRINSDTKSTWKQVRRKSYLAFRGMSKAVAESIYDHTYKITFSDWSKEKLLPEGWKRERYLEHNHINGKVAQLMFDANSMPALESWLKEKIPADFMIDIYKNLYNVARKSNFEGWLKSEIVTYKVVPAVTIEEYLAKQDYSSKDEMKDLFESLQTSSIEELLGDGEHTTIERELYLKHQGISEDEMKILFTSIQKAQENAKWLDSTISVEGEEVKVSNFLQGKGLSNDLYDSARKNLTNWEKKTITFLDNRIATIGEILDEKDLSKEERNAFLSSIIWTKNGAKWLDSTISVKGEEVKVSNFLQKKGLPDDMYNSIHDSYFEPWANTIIRVTDKKILPMENQIQGENITPKEVENFFSNMKMAKDDKNWWKSRVTLGGHPTTVRKFLEKRDLPLNLTYWKQKDYEVSVSRNISIANYLSDRGIHGYREMTSLFKSIVVAKDQTTWLDSEIRIGGNSVKVSDFLQKNRLDRAIIYDKFPKIDFMHMESRSIKFNYERSATIGEILDERDFSKDERQSIFNSIEHAEDFQNWFMSNLDKGTTATVPLKELLIRRIPLGQEGDVERFFEGIKQSKDETTWLDSTIYLGGKNVKLKTFLEENQLDNDLYTTIPDIDLAGWERTTIILPDNRSTTIGEILDERDFSKEERHILLNSIYKSKGDVDHTKWENEIVEISSATPLVVTRAEKLLIEQEHDRKNITQKTLDDVFNKASQALFENFYGGTDGTKKVEEALSSLSLPAEERDAMDRELRRELHLARQGKWSAEDVINQYIKNPIAAARISEQLALKPHEEPTLDDTEHWLTTEPESIYGEVGKLNQLWRNRITLDVIHYKMLVGVPMDTLKEYFERLDIIDEEALEKLPPRPLGDAKKATGQFGVEKEEKELIKAEMEFQNHWVKNLQNSYTRFHNNHEMEEDLRVVINHTNAQVAKADSDRLQVMEIMKDASKTSGQRQKMLKHINIEMGRPLKDIKEDELYDKLADVCKKLEDIIKAQKFKTGKEGDLPIGEILNNSTTCISLLARYNYEKELREALDTGDRQRARDLITGTGRERYLKEKTADLKSAFEKHLDRVHNKEKMLFSAEVIREQMIWFVILSLGFEFNQAMGGGQQGFDRINTRLVAMSFK